MLCAEDVVKYSLMFRSGDVPLTALFRIWRQFASPLAGLVAAVISYVLCALLHYAPSSSLVYVLLLITPLTCGLRSRLSFRNSISPECRPPVPPCLGLLMLHAGLQAWPVQADLIRPWPFIPVQS